MTRAKTTTTTAYTHRRNCWTCPHSGDRADRCAVLTLDEDADQPILDWLDAAPLARNGTVPRDADGCPGWGSR